MRDRLTATLLFSAIALAMFGGDAALATEQGISGKKLLLKGSKFVLLSKDPGIAIAGSDPVVGADSSITFDDGSGPVTLPLPATLWTTNGSGSLFKYKNTQAPSGPSVVRVAKAKAGLIKVVRPARLRCRTARRRSTCGSVSTAGPTPTA